MEQLGIIAELAKMVPPKATAEEIALYNQYLYDLDSTIRSQVFTGTIRKAEDFEQRVELYNTTYNPKGKELYDDRYEHYIRITYNISSKEWKKMKKEMEPKTAQQPQQPKKVFEQKE